MLPSLSLANFLFAVITRSAFTNPTLLLLLKGKECRIRVLMVSMHKLVDTPREGVQGYFDPVDISILHR